MFIHTYIRTCSLSHTHTHTHTHTHSLSQTSHIQLYSIVHLFFSSPSLSISIALRACVVVTSKSPPASSIPMATATVSAEPEATSEMCAYCFDTLRHHFMETSSQSASSPAAPVQRFDEAFCPLFVTWNIHPRGFETTTSGNGTNGASLKKEGRLRGCIGTLSSTSISTGLREYALISSLRDRRFNPISTEELPRLSVTVSLLTHYEDAKDVYDWEVGVHGIILNFRWVMIISCIPAIDVTSLPSTVCTCCCMD